MLFGGLSPAYAGSLIPDLRPDAFRLSFMWRSWTSLPVTNLYSSQAASFWAPGRIRAHAVPPPAVLRGPRPTGRTATSHSNVSLRCATTWAGMLVYMASLPPANRLNRPPWAPESASDGETWC